MTPFRPLGATGICAAALGLLAACGPDDVTRAEYFSPEVTGALTPSASITLSPDQLRQIAASGEGQPLMLARIGSDAIVPMTGRSRGAQAVWSTQDGTQFFTEDDMIFATASVGTDLIGTEAPRGPVQSRVGQQYVRSYQHNTPSQVIVTNYDCAMEAAGNEDVMILDVSYATTRLVESCEGPDGAGFENAYWVDQGGAVRQSRQWVNAELGTVEMLRLIQ